MFLTALSPPGNIERVICDIQRQLFKKYSLISSMGIQPLIPLVFSNTEPSKTDLISITRQPPGEFSTGEYSIEKKSLFLRINQHSKWEDIKSRLHKSIPSFDNFKEKKLFPEYPGFFLSNTENNLDFDLKKLEILKPIRWNLTYLTCIKIDIKSRIWWENISCEIVFEEKIKKKHD